MKKVSKLLLVVLIGLFIYNIKVFALSGSLSVSKSSVHVGDSFKVTVNLKDTTAWNIHVSASGPVTCNNTENCNFSSNKCVINESDVEPNAKDINKSFTNTCKATGEGTITFSLDNSDITSSSEQTMDLNSTKKVAVTKASTNNKLSSLTVDGVSVVDFSAETTSYKMDSEKSSIKIAAVAEDSKSKVSGTGNKTVKYGSNKYEIKVTAESGSTKVYTIVVNKKDTRENNNYLSSLIVSAGNIEFNKDTTSYTLNVGSNVDKITVSATAESSKAKVKGTGEKTLKEGSNKIEIEVIAENESIKKYIINVNKSTNEDYIKSLTIEDIDLSFDPNVYEYEVSLDNQNNLKFNYDLTEGATATISGNENLVDGSKVVLTVAKGSATKEYTFNIKKQSNTKTEEETAKEKNNSLSILAIMCIIIIMLVSGLLGYIIGKRKANN